jgi:endonuclease YncB( thermonuclease family)
MFDAISQSTGDIYFLKLRTVGDSGDLRDKYVEITAHLFFGDAGKLSLEIRRRKDVRKTKVAEGLITNYINQQRKRCIVKVVKQK